MQVWKEKIIAKKKDLAWTLKHCNVQWTQLHEHFTKDCIYRQTKYVYFLNISTF